MRDTWVTHLLKERISKQMIARQCDHTGANSTRKKNVMNGVTTFIDCMICTQWFKVFDQRNLDQIWIIIEMTVKNVLMQLVERLSIMRWLISTHHVRLQFLIAPAR